MLAHNKATILINILSHAGLEPFKFSLTDRGHAINSKVMEGALPMLKRLWKVVEGLSNSFSTDRMVFEVP
jgi:hypothetical protein